MDARTCLCVCVHLHLGAWMYSCWSLPHFTPRPPHCIDVCRAWPPGQPDLRGAEARLSAPAVEPPLPAQRHHHLLRHLLQHGEPGAGHPVEEPHPVGAADHRAGGQPGHQAVLLQDGCLHQGGARPPLQHRGCLPRLRCRAVRP